MHVIRMRSERSESRSRLINYFKSDIRVKSPETITARISVAALQTATCCTNLVNSTIQIISSTEFADSTLTKFVTCSFLRQA
jgi:hypothetical protein